MASEATAHVWLRLVISKRKTKIVVNTSALLSVLPILPFFADQICENIVILRVTKLKYVVTSICQYVEFE